VKLDYSKNNSVTEEKTVKERKKNAKIDERK
jgi:hypothetical protein